MPSCWTLQETIGSLHSPLIAGELDTLFPWHGFQPAASKRAEVALLKVFTRAADHATPETIADSYTRGDDLVVTYAQTPARNVRVQLYWRHVNESDTCAGVELILSTQTSLLDSQPATTIESTLPPGDVLAFDAQGDQVEKVVDAWQSYARAPRAILFRPRDLSVSYLELIEPTDFAGVLLTQLSNSPTVRWHLFPEALEKGVIRRGRVRGLFIPRERDQELVKPLMHSFAASPLVLST